jgi:protein-disulfide isomerase
MASPTTKKESRARAREERLARERAQARRGRRRRRLWQLGGALGLAACLVVVAIVLSRSGTSTPATGGRIVGAAEVNARFAGIPQRGTALGSPKAPVTMVEFADLQCPFCREFAQSALPTLVRDYVRPGRLRIEFRALSFIGPDSQRAAQAAAGAARQDKLWPFVDLFYVNQGQENTGYVTDGFLRKVGASVRGLDVPRALREGTGPAATAQLRQAQALAARYGVGSTPSFLIGRTGGALSPLTVSSLGPSQFTNAIDRLAP